MEERYQAQVSQTLVEAELDVVAALVSVEGPAFRAEDRLDVGVEEKTWCFQKRTRPCVRRWSRPGAGRSSTARSARLPC